MVILYGKLKLSGILMCPVNFEALTLQYAYDITYNE